MFGKKKNKTFDRDKKLDLKKRSKQSRVLRARMAMLALATSSLVVMVALIVWKGREVIMDDFVYNSPAFAIERIDIQTDGVIPLEQIRSWTAVKLGESLLKIDLNRIKRDLELVALVKSASVERQFPKRLVIRVKEREPIAQIFIFQPGQNESIRSTVFFLDEDGWLMPETTKFLSLKSIPNRPSSFPVITGVQGIDMRPGRKVQSRQMLAALQLIKQFPESPMSGRADLKEIDIADANTLLVTTEGGSLVTFAPMHFDSQLLRWRKIHDYAHSVDKLVAQLNLAVTNYIPLTWAQQEEHPLPPTSPAKQIPPARRKNV